MKPAGILLMIPVLLVCCTGSISAQNFVFEGNNPFGIDVFSIVNGKTPYKMIFEDRDGDGDKDLFWFTLGSDSTNQFKIFSLQYEVLYQENTGTPQTPVFGEVEVIYDDLTLTDGPFFPALGDLNNDGAMDIVASADVDTFSEVESLRFYFGAGEGMIDSFLSMSAADYGCSDMAPYSMLMPEFVDLDGDNDLDLLLSGLTISVIDNDSAKSVCMMARNDGTPEVPEFTSWFLNTFNSKQDTAFEFMTAADIDNDGDQDLIGIANSEGLTKLLVHENQPSGNNAMGYLDPVVSPYGMPIATGEIILLSPDFVDIDDDGDLDLFIVFSKNQNPRVRFYENTLCEVVTGELEATICEGEVYMVGDEEYTEAGQYAIELKAMNGCDSVLNLTLNILPILHNTLFASICEGDSYVAAGEEFTFPGTYQITTVAENGCDSLIELTLEVIEPVEEFLFIEICDGESYLVGEEEFNTGGVYEIVFTAASGCDSLVILDLAINPASEILIEEDLCDGDLIFVGGEEISESGTYEFTLTDANGCDSLITAIIDFHKVEMSVEQNGNVLTATGNATEYQWVDCNTGLDIDGEINAVFEPAVSGSYKVRGTDIYGCDGESECVAVVISATDEPAWATGIALFPNPASDRIFVRNESGLGITKVTIVDNSGRSVLFPVNALSGGFNLQSFAPGVYFMQIGVGEHQLVRKFIVAGSR